MRELKQNKTILFTNQLNSDELNSLISGCKALLMPGEEDFGITALEASNFGKPVIVFYRSGVSELLKDGQNAVFIKKETTNEVIDAIKKINKLNFDQQQIKLQVSRLNKDKFKDDKNVKEFSASFTASDFRYIYYDKKTESIYLKTENL